MIKPLFDRLVFISIIFGMNSKDDRDVTYPFLWLSL